MHESESKKYFDLARAVMGEAHTHETISALASHAAALVALRSSCAGAADVVSIGTRVSECLYMTKDAVVAVAGDTLEARKEAAHKCFTFLKQAADLPRSIARVYMHATERFKDTGLDPSVMTVRDLFAHL